MSDTLAHWLRLREPWDAAARSEHVLRAAIGALPSGTELHLLDLATGTGSNIRYLAERLPSPQHWTAVDCSADLLDELRRRMTEWADERGYDARVDGRSCVVQGPAFECRIDTRQMNLSTISDVTLFEGHHLVAASALLDLVSSEWLRQLADRCARARTVALFAMTYDGTTTCTPPEREDLEILTLFNRHQLTDKGLGGPAAGPGAVQSAAQAFADAGYRVVRERSDWVVDSAAPALQQMLIDGWAQASAEMAPERAAAIADWRRRRMGHVTSGISRVIVGHEDLAAYVVT